MRATAAADAEGARKPCSATSCLCWCAKPRTARCGHGRGAVHLAATAAALALAQELSRVDGASQVLPGSYGVSGVQGRPSRARRRRLHVDGARRTDSKRRRGAGEKWVPGAGTRRVSGDHPRLLGALDSPLPREPQHVQECTRAAQVRHVRRAPLRLKTLVRAPGAARGEAASHHESHRPPSHGGTCEGQRDGRAVKTAALSTRRGGCRLLVCCLTMGHVTPLSSA